MVGTLKSVISVQLIILSILLIPSKLCLEYDDAQ
jgi:hypothetical protein